MVALGIFSGEVTIKFLTIMFVETNHGSYKSSLCFVIQILRVLKIFMSYNVCFIKNSFFWEFYTSIWIENTAVCLLALSRLYIVLAASFVMVYFPCFLT